MKVVDGKILGFKSFVAKNGVEWYVINASFPFVLSGNSHVEGDDCKPFWVRACDLTFKPAVGGKVKVGVRYGGADLVQ